MASPKLNPRGDSFLSFDYLAAIENGIFKISLIIDEIPDDLKITYQFASGSPWHVIKKLENTTTLNAAAEIKDFASYDITVTLSSKGKTFTFATPVHEHAPYNAINYMTDNADFVNWRAKLNNLYSSKYAELTKSADFVRPLEHFRIARPNIHVIVHNAPVFPAANRTEHEQKIWDNVDKYGDPTAIRDALWEKPPRLITHAWDEFKYEDIAGIADCISGNKAKFYINDQGVFTVSDSTSHFVNTVSGHRITHGQPEKSEHTIWHIGYCRVFGNGAPDWGTVDSFLQRRINEEIPDKKIRVENFGYNNMCSHPDQPMKILRSLEPYMRDGDIVIIDSISGFPNVNGVLRLDISQMLQRPHSYGECFFDRSHFTENGNRAVAEKLFDFIQENKLLEFDAEIIFGNDIAGGGASQHLLSVEKRLQLEAYLSKIVPLRPLVGSIVMNCNPFTLGHRYLIERAAAKCEKLFIFVVEEDKSIFPFADRIELVRQGTAGLKNVEVIPSGKFIISSLTFTDYFGKSEMQDRTIDPSLDVELFGRYIAPQMGINIRFAGEEPLDNVTRQYNEAMGRILPRHGVAFEVIPRTESGGQVISASRVRKLLEEKDFKEIKKLVPKTTLKYLKKGAKMNNFSLSCLCNLSVGKNAWQSSEYGGNNAANVLNDDGQRDFGFHTNPEDNPWWEIDLKDVYKISHIKVANRRKVCQEKAGTLTVEVSESGEEGDWRTVHTGIMHWDGDVTFFLAGRVKARWVRLSLKEYNAFHLANVEIWGCAPSVKQITPPAPERFCLHDAQGLGGLDEISKNAAVTKNGNALIFDFKDIYPIEAVVLEKPLSAGWDGGESLRMEISRDGRSWRRIHEGLMFWAAKMYYPLRGEVIGRYLRLSPGPETQEKKNFIKSLLFAKRGLGFEKARIFTKKAGLTVIAARPDGLGARLGSLLRAIYMSKILNCDFKVVWETGAKWMDLPDYKADGVNIMGLIVAPAKEVFQQDFIDKHFTGSEAARQGGKFYGAVNIFRRHLLDGKYSDSPGKILSPVYVNPSDKRYPSLGLNQNLAPDEKFGAEDIFYSIPFHPAIQSAIKKAREVSLPEKLVAIHARSGDLVYRPICRRAITYDTLINARERVVTTLLVKMLVKSLLDENVEFLLFTEDTSMAGIVNAAYPGLIHAASEFYPDEELSLEQRSIFEMVLMSRASRIYAPKTSAFSALPSFIGRNVEYHSIHDIFTKEEVLDFYLSDLESNQGTYPPLMEAMAYRQLYALFMETKPPLFLIGLLEKAAARDPETEFYPFYQAVEYCRIADYENGEKMFQQFLGMVTDMGGKPADIIWPPAPAVQETIKNAALNGLPATCRVMALLCEKCGNKSEISEWMRLASHGGLTNLAPLGRARQSSDLEWKTRTDAANAFNDDGQRDFGFHTKEEENPWWEVELTDLCAIHRIVLVNRRKVCQEKIISLTVEVSAEQAGDGWVTVHTGLISWDGSLALPLAGLVSARRVRLSLREKRMFHLASVEIWGTPLSARLKSPIEPEFFHLCDWKPENGRGVSLQAPPAAAPGLLVAEMTAAAPLEALIISKTGAENWPDMKIETSRDGQNWLTVHEGLMHWAGQMHYPIQGEVFARFVRLSSQIEAQKSEKASPIDLEIFATKEKQGFCVVHRQHDGLGGRMISLLNAMYLADALAVPLGIVWPVLKRPSFECDGIDVLGIDVDDADRVFDENFRSAHLRRDISNTMNSALLGKRGLTRRNLLSPAVMSEPGLINSSHGLELKTQLAKGLAPSDPVEIGRYFKQVGFSPEMRMVIEAAEKVDLAGAMAAVHLRAGDLVYRSAHTTSFEDCLFSFQTKGMPVQLARMSIEHALEAGFKKVIIFSDDVTVSQVLADDYEAGHYARQFWPDGELSNTQIGLFEAVLMSRASIIYRPDTSSFSRFARIISEGVEMIGAHVFFKPEAILPYFQTDLKKNGARYPALQNAYSYGYLYRVAKGGQDADFLLEMITAAAAAAPENVTFKVFKALELFRAGRDGEGEAALREVFSFNRRAKTFDLIDKASMALRNKDFINWKTAEILPVFEAAAKRGNPFACHITALFYEKNGKQAEAAAWHEAALRNI